MDLKEFCDSSISILNVCLECDKFADGNLLFMQNEVKMMGAKVKIKTNFDQDFPFYMKGQRCLKDKSLKIIIDKNK